MIPASYKAKKKFMQLAIAEAKRARDRGDYAIGAVITRLTGNKEVVIANAGNRVKTSGSSIKHVERSEEHTSELQSPCNLVCRLLLEKKNSPTRGRAA